MTVSSIGSSSSAQSLYLQYLQSLLGSSSAGSDVLSSLQDDSSDSLSISPQAQWMSQNQSSNPLKADMDKLGQLIQSGDISGAKDAFAKIQEHLQAHQSTSSKDSDPMGTALAALGTALDSGDASSAQKAWTSLQQTFQNQATKQMGGESGDVSYAGSASLLQAQLLAASMGLSGVTTSVSE